MEKRLSESRILQIILWVAVFEAVSAAIGYITRPEVDGWYAALVRPWFTPPNFVFPVMWTLLYALIAAAGFYIWSARGVGGAAGKRRVYLFALYMALNWSWSFIFFTGGQLLAGFIWIIAMNIVTAVILVLCWREVRRAALLLLPPFAWTLFAAVLNGAFWWLNRGG